MLTLKMITEQTERVIAGLEKPQNGTIEMDGHLVVNERDDCTSTRTE